MNEFTIVTVIGRPVEDVFAVIRDVDRTPLWIPGLSEVHITSDGPLEAGSTLVYQGTFLGRGYTSPVLCTGLTENKQYATRTTAGPFYLETDITLEPVAEGTRITATYRGESHGFFKLAEPLVVRLSKKYFESAGENLRTLMEDHAI
jgi:ribosome-associated toxin RatA of RatAB toxin-antitoxin module